MKQAVWLVYQHQPKTDRYSVVALYDNGEAAKEHVASDGRAHQQAYVMMSSFGEGWDVPTPRNVQPADRLTQA